MRLARVSLLLFVLISVVFVTMASAKKKPVPEPTMTVTYPTPVPTPTGTPDMKPDEVETLINTEELEMESWKDSEGDLPPILMVGDHKAFLAYAAPNERARDPMLCSAIEFDELLELSKDEAMPDEVIVNVKKPRVRDAISDNCLVRPGDPVMAIGPGWQMLVVARDFVVRRERYQCLNDPPSSLWVTFDAELPSEPIFFTTNLQLSEGSNDYKSSNELSISSFTKTIRWAVGAQVQFLDEYEPKVISVSAPNCDHLIHLRKKLVTPNDAELPNEVILTEKDGGVDLLLMEKVDPKKGSGHVVLEGIFDSNKDGKMDLVLKGDHQGCPFRVVFQGLEIGFERLELPYRGCACL